MPHAVRPYHLAVRVFANRHGPPLTAWDFNSTLDGRFAHQVAFRRDLSERVEALKDSKLRADRINF
jgi:hypothetical protein